MLTYIDTRCAESYFVTLTSRRGLDSYGMSREVARLFDRVNKKLFGTHYARHRRVYLATYAVQERTLNEALHTHVIVGVPPGSLQLKANPPKGRVDEIILQTWIDLDPVGRRAKGQDARPVYYLLGVAGYINKRVRSLDDFDAVDVANTIYPA